MEWLLIGLACVLTVAIALALFSWWMWHDLPLG